MRRSTAFFLCCLAIVAGVAVHSLLRPGARFTDPFSFYVAFLTLLILAALLFQKNKKFAIGFLIGGCFLLGFWRYAASIPEINASHIGWYVGQEMRLRGLVVSEPDPREKITRYRLGDVQRMENSKTGEYQTMAGKILLSARPLPAYRYGDVMETVCRLEKPEPIEGFDYASYLARQDVYALCAFPESVRLIASDRGSWIQSRLFAAKARLTASIGRILPEPHASFLGGILYGARRSIPEDLSEAFRRTGTSHLIALSGYNISVVAGFILAILSRLWIPRRTAFPLAVVALIAFILLAGAGASLVRAGIMGGIVLLARYSGRLSSARNILTLSAAVMLLQNPKILAFDVGFQLSFAATIGLVVFGPYFSEKLSFVTGWMGLREAASSTFAAMLATLPLILYHFGTLSLISPLVNFLVVPAIPVTMMTGFVAGVAGMIWVKGGLMLGYFAWLPLEYEITVIRRFARFPIVEKQIPMTLMITLYLFIVFLAWRALRRPVEIKP